MTHEEATIEKKKLDKSEERYYRKLREISGKKAVLMANCPHKETETKTIFHEGGYLNTSWYEYNTICKLCGKLLNSREENTGSYV